MAPKLFPILVATLTSLAACQHQKPTASPIGKIKPQFDPDSAHRINSLEPREILNRLYDSPVIHGRTAIWHPNYSETMSFFRASYDDSCHTTIDTVLYFKDRDSTNCAVIVFATYHYFVDSLDGMKIKIGDCHSCGAVVGMALFSQDTDRRWQNYAFTKSLTISGVSGGTTAEGIGQFSLVRLGDRWTGLLLKKPVYANTGAEEAGAELYSIEETNLNGYLSGDPLRAILSYTYHSSYHEPGFAEREENTALEVVERKRQYQVRLVTMTNQKRNVRYYRYSDDDEKYIPVRER
jgi:hypothetical protein